MYADREVVLQEAIEELTHDLEMAQEEIERLREACKNVSSYISVRDQFAMAALTGMLMRSVGYEETSEKAYKFADAMIKTRAALGEKE